MGMGAALVSALAGIGQGVYLLGVPVDITELGVPFFALFLLIVPGLLVVWALLAPRARKWLLRRTSRVQPSMTGWRSWGRAMSGIACRVPSTATTPAMTGTNMDARPAQ